MTHLYWSSQELMMGGVFIYQMNDKKFINRPIEKLLLAMII
jgi:hypothetical protein